MPYLPHMASILQACLLCEIFDWPPLARQWVRHALSHEVISWWPHELRGRLWPLSESLKRWHSERAVWRHAERLGHKLAVWIEFLSHVRIDHLFILCSSFVISFFFFLKLVFFFFEVHYFFWYLCHYILLVLD